MNQQQAVSAKQLAFLAPMAAASASHTARSPQIGLDFGEAQFTSIEMPAGTWTPAPLDSDALANAIDTASAYLANVPGSLIKLFAAGLKTAQDLVAEIRADGKRGAYRWHELRDVDIAADPLVVEEFVAQCRKESMTAPERNGRSWKFRETFSRSIYAVYVENVGTLVAGRYGAEGHLRLEWEPGPRGKFFLSSYADSMPSVCLPYAVWGPTYCADKIAYSGEGVASVSTFRHQGREYVITGASGLGQTMCGNAWRLCLLDDWNAERYTYQSSGAAVELGKLERSDRRGTVVSVRGTLYVLEAAAEVYDSSVTSLVLADSGSDADIEADAGLMEVGSEDLDEEIYAV